jgi:cell division protein FtsZ
MSPASRDIGHKYTRDAVMEAATSPSVTSSLRAMMRGADMVVIAAAMGGRTGTVASPVVARIAKESGAMVLAFVTSPFCFEDKEWKRAAADCTARLRPEVDQTISVPRSRLKYLNRYHRVCFGPPFPNESWMISQGILSVIEPLNTPGLINPRLADVEKVMRMSGEGVMNTGEGWGCHPVAEASEEALNDSDLPSQLARAKGLLLHLRGFEGMSLTECLEIADVISRHGPPACIANCVSRPEEELRGTPAGVASARLTLIATGLQPKGTSWQ